MSSLNTLAPKLSDDTKGAYETRLVRLEVRYQLLLSLAPELSDPVSHLSHLSPVPAARTAELREAVQVRAREVCLQQRLLRLPDLAHAGQVLGQPSVRKVLRKANPSGTAKHIHYTTNFLRHNRRHSPPGPRRGARHPVLSARVSRTGPRGLGVSKFDGSAAVRLSTGIWLARYS